MGAICYHAATELSTAVTMKTKSAIKQVRLNNLHDLFDKYKKENNLPDRGAGAAFAKKIGLSARHFTVIKNGASNMGDVVAKRIEENLGLDPGYMDQAHSATEPKSPEEIGFMETAMLLFRLSPESAQDAMIEALRKRLAGHLNKKTE